jgi:SAM-dependent methyltransferase
MVGSAANGMSITECWQAAARLVAAHRDVVDARTPSPLSPLSPLSTRGWAQFLRSLDDEELAALEIGGHSATWPSRAPASLLALVAAARDVCALPMLPEPEPASPISHASPTSHASHASPQRRRETPRKRAQIDAFARIVLPVARDASRIFDVGSGHGHLTRAIAERIDRPVVGLDRDQDLAARARSLPSTATPSFAVTDVLRDGLSLGARDCVIGLHACGELGDVMVESAARSGASIALVGCCLQKRRAASRAPLSALAPLPASALELPRDILGLSNLTARDDGVEATRAENLAGRERRLALHRLLEQAGEQLPLGAEIRGLNRRAAHGELATLVARAFAARRQPPPSAAAIAEAATWARVQHAEMRRLSLPRGILARVLEVLVLADRARHLEAHGRDVTIGLIFPASVSPRNLVLVSTATSS